MENIFPQKRESMKNSTLDSTNKENSTELSIAHNRSEAKKSEQYFRGGRSYTPAPLGLLPMIQNVMMEFGVIS